MDRVRNISKSMMSYLKRAREHKEFLLRETKEFERGKRHLANMMNIEPDQMTQDDIDHAIKYLFPSGLFEPKARPMMKHPDLLFKAQKDAQFNFEGRPNHYLFYTIKPNYHETLSELARQVRILNKFEDKQHEAGIFDAPSNAKYDLESTTWIDILECNKKFLETLSEDEYQYLIESLNRLIAHPYSKRAEAFINKFTKELQGQTMNLELPEIFKDKETGEIYTDITTLRREHEVRVKTVLNGSGKFDFEGYNILYFDAPYLRQAIYHPLKLSGMQDKIDIFANFVRKPRTVGQSAIAGCIRQAVSISIAAHSDNDIKSRLRLAGLLTPDPRCAERKKFGQAKARKKYTWKRR